MTKFKIAMRFEEALERFAGVEHKEMQESLSRPTRKRISPVPKPWTRHSRLLIIEDVLGK